MKKYYIFFALLIIVVFCFWFADKDARSDVDSKIVTDKPIPQREISKRPAPRQITIDNEGVERPDGLSEEHWQRYLTMYAIQKSANKEINFYGRVIDQYGDPVVAMKLDIVILGYHTSLKDYMRKGKRQTRKDIVIYTDSGGFFSVESQVGTYINVEKMTKEGYSLPKYGANYSFVYGSFAAVKDSNMYHSPEKHNPVVFTLWKKGVTEPIIKKSEWVDIIPDKGIKKRYLPFSLKGRASLTPNDEWDVGVSGYNNGGDDWEVILDVKPGAGLLISDDVHTNLAPASGYQDRIIIRSSDWVSRAARPSMNVYYRSKNGKKFAVFRVVVSSGGRNMNGMFRVYFRDLKINPNGSRNLEYDPEKEIRIDNWAR